jgi:hypothetical protein
MVLTHRLSGLLARGFPHGASRTVLLTLHARKQPTEEEMPLLLPSLNP